jgi:hypothetical protein
MEKKSVYNTRDGRSYDMNVSWNPEIKLTETVFPIAFKFTDRATGRPLKLPREIATFAIGDPGENLGEKIETYFGGDKNAMFIDYVEMAIRRVTDYVERGR